MPYYALFEEDNGENISMLWGSAAELDLRSGRAIPQASIEAPIPLLMRVEEDDCYDQYDPDFEGTFTPRAIPDRLKASYNDGTLLSEKFATALRDAGARDLQCIATEICNEETGERLRAPYVLVNILRRLDCAERRTRTDEEGNRFADGLAIDEGKALGHAIFRLDIAPSTVVVSEDLARVLERDASFGVRAELLPSVNPTIEPR